MPVTILLKGTKSSLNSFGYRIEVIDLYMAPPKSNAVTFIIAFVLFFIPEITVLAQVQGSNTLKPTLLIFSGSDWCLPCLRFDKDVRQNQEFIDFANQYLTVLVADFPQRTKLDKATIQRNEALAAQYNPNGIFPLVLLLDSQGALITEIATNKVSAQDVINQISKNLPREAIIEHSRATILMGSAFQITLVAPESSGQALLEECIREIESIEAWLSSWQEGSVTSRINKQAGKGAVSVDPEYYQFIQRCKEISAVTQGAFDITFHSLSALYTFDRGEHALPPQDDILAITKHIGYTKINLDQENYVALSDSLTKISFGAIGKGYAAERVKKLMVARGVSGGVINASGDLTTWGKRANGEFWRVGIPNPANKNEILLWLPLEEKAIATSGDYEKYFTSNGVRYSHIINPVTGIPVVGSPSVSVISNNAELCDAMATSVAVLGVEVGMNLINQMPGTECVFIDNLGKLHFSDGLKPYEN